MDGGNFVVAPIGCGSFLVGPLYSNLVLDVLISSAIIFLRNTTGCFTLIVL